MNFRKPTALMLALGLAFPLIASADATTDELLKELRALKARVAELEAKQKAAETAPAAGGMTADQTQDFNRIAVKAEAMEDNFEAQGFKGLKITGVMDPTYIYNRARNTSSVVFLNNFCCSAPSVFAYDNSYFGSAAIDFQKELEGGTKWHLTIIPHKSVGSNYNFPSIVHEASVSIPITDLNTRFWAGQVPDWSGYEYYLPNQTKLITHNMMFDYLAPTYYTAFGTDVINGKWEVKTSLGNMNSSRNDLGPNGEKALKSPVFSTRVDYSKGEFNGWGGAIQVGKAANNVAGGYTQLVNGEIDGYFVRGALTVQGQVNYGQQKLAAFNGGDASWYGASVLGAYKVTPRLELVARGDYLNNQKNGGGTFNLFFDADATTGAALPDGRNGFGPGAVRDDVNGGWTVADPNKGANRYALSLGFNYALTQNAVFKAEYRYDRANQSVFYYSNTDEYKKDNHVLGTAVVVSF
jgi:hypothetical protein